MSEGSSGPVRATALAVAGDLDVAETLRVVRGELGPPHPVPLPEFPELSPGTEPLGRTVTHLESLHVDLGPHGWRLTAARAGDSGVSRRVRRAHASLLGVDADVLAGEPAGPTVIRVVGPATLGSALALPSGEPLLSDAGALRDVAEAWEEGLVRLVESSMASLPGAQIVLRLEEPGLSDALAGRVRSSSGYRTLRALDRAQPRQWWASLTRRAPVWVPWHPLVGVVPDAAAHAGQLPGEHPAAWEEIGALVEAGHDVVLQVPWAAHGRRESVASRALRVATPWRRLGLAAADLSRLTLSGGTAAAQGLDELKDAAIRVRDLADALDVVRHDDLEGLL